MKYQTLITVEDVGRVLTESSYGVWARLKDRDDWLIYSKTGVRIRGDVLQVNAGEYDYARDAYINEEWLTPAFVYIKHPCAGCHYPPNMCCYSGDDDGADDDWIDAAIERDRSVPAVTLVEIEL